MMFPTVCSGTSPPLRLADNEAGVLIGIRLAEWQRTSTLAMGRIVPSLFVLLHIGAFALLVAFFLSTQFTLPMALLATVSFRPQSLLVNYDPV